MTHEKYQTHCYHHHILNNIKMTTSPHLTFVAFAATSFFLPSLKNRPRSSLSLYKRTEIIGRQAHARQPITLIQQTERVACGNLTKKNVSTKPARTRYQHNSFAGSMNMHK